MFFINYFLFDKNKWIYGRGDVLRITLFCSSFSGGGAEKVIVNLANYYASVGHEVKLMLLHEEGPYRKEVASGYHKHELSKIPF